MKLASEEDVFHRFFFSSPPLIFIIYARNASEVIGLAAIYRDVVNQHPDPRSLRGRVSRLIDFPSWRYNFHLALFFFKGNTIPVRAEFFLLKVVREGLTRSAPIDYPRRRGRNAPGQLEVSENLPTLFLKPCRTMLVDLARCFSLTYKFFQG